MSVCARTFALSLCSAIDFLRRLIVPYWRCVQCSESLQPQSDKILNAISVGMRPEEKNPAIKLAATMALANSLEFARQNMLKEVGTVC